MTILYNCRHDGDQFRISKFDDAMNIESSYLLTLLECDCPAGSRPTCRHRAMLPKFIAESHISDGYFYDFDRGGWVQMWQEEPLPSFGVQIFGMDNLLGLHNAIADAVGEPRIEPVPAPQADPMDTSKTLLASAARTTQAEPTNEILNDIPFKQSEETTFHYIADTVLPPLPEGVVIVPVQELVTYNEVAAALGEPPHINRRGR